MAEESFKIDLHFTLTTQRLKLIPAQFKHLAYYNPLFSSKEVMEKVLYGNPYDTSQLYKREYKVEGVKFKEIIATVRVDNTASIKILGRFFKEKGELFKYGAARKCFSLELGNTCLIEPQ